MIRSSTPVRSLRDVSLTVWCALAVALAMQIILESRSGSEHAASYRALASPPPAALVRLMALGDAQLASRLMMLTLQAHDTQPGLSMPLAAIDYERVIRWLEVALELAPDSQYPLLSAVRIYAAVREPNRQRLMLEFVRRAFLTDPARRWRWMAESVIIAKHRLRDQALALELASQLTERAHDAAIPAWARDMSIIILEEMGELEAARTLIGGLIHEGRITDPNELRFLNQKLVELEAEATAQQDEAMEMGPSR